MAKIMRWRFQTAEESEPAAYKRTAGETDHQTVIHRPKQITNECGEAFPKEGEMQRQTGEAYEVL